MVIYDTMDPKEEEQNTRVYMIALEFWKERCKYYWGFHWEYGWGVREFKDTSLGYQMGSLSTIYGLPIVFVLSTEGLIPLPFALPSLLYY